MRFLMGDPTTLLLVEDDHDIRTPLTQYLEGAGFEVRARDSVAGALDALDASVDLVLLDLGLPDGDGSQILERASQDVRTPVIIVTARAEMDSRVRGLEAGADDYVVKPFEPLELVARIRSVLRRTTPQRAKSRIEVGPLWVDPEAGVAGRGEIRFSLAPREFELFTFFLQNPDRVWTRDQILERVWAGSGGDVRTVDSNVRRLRSQIEVDGTDPHYLKTVWGVGYCLVECAE